MMQKNGIKRQINHSQKCESSLLRIIVPIMLSVSSSQYIGVLRLTLHATFGCSFNDSAKKYTTFVKHKSKVYITSNYAL